VKRASLKENQILLGLSSGERDMLNRLRASLIPNSTGLLASVGRHPESGLWQGWISEGTFFIFISARRDLEQAYADIEAFLDAIEREDFDVADAVPLLARFNEGGDAPPKALPEDLTKALRFFVHILYKISASS
jgi:hypothetical protein